MEEYLTRERAYLWYLKIVAWHTDRVTRDRNSSNAWKVLSLSLSLSLSLGSSISSFAEAGICDEVRAMRGERWEFVHRKIPQSQEKQEERESCHPGAAARAGRSSRMFEHKVPVGFPDINTDSTPTPLPLLNSLTTDPLPQPDTHTHTHTQTHTHTHTHTA